MCPEEFIFPAPRKTAAFTDEWACQKCYLARLVVIELIIRRVVIVGDDDWAKADNYADDKDVEVKNEMCLLSCQYKSNG